MKSEIPPSHAEQRSAKPKKPHFCTDRLHYYEPDAATCVCARLRNHDTEGPYEAKALELAADMLERLTESELDGRRGKLVATIRFGAHAFKKLALIDAGLHAATRIGCPCLYATPCHPQCTCMMPVSSHGCARCCSYGSREQQTKMAEGIVSREAHAAALADRLTRLQEQVEKLQYWNSWMTDPASPSGACISKRCVSRDEVLALLALPQDGEVQ